ALGVSESVIADFSHEFRTGMAQESRARQLGDVERNAPEHWEWGRLAEEPHALVMFFGKPDHFDSFVHRLTGVAWDDAFERVRWLPTGNLDRFEPFGFADGISQPKLDWEQERAFTKIQLDYTNEAALGEFLLGYRNEYGKFTDRPLLKADALSTGLLTAEDEPEKKDIARNGTYLVMRQLEQDVRTFWKFLHEQSGGDTGEAGKLAAAIVGRTEEGDPLVPLQEEAIPGIDAKETQNRFTFASDPAGALCPFGAHVRRANPRNPDFPNRPASLFKKIVTMLGFGPGGFRDDLMSPVRFHRILRRGREYGSELKREDALAPAPPDEPPRGLYFICLNANISRQFEFLQNAWMTSTKFSGLTGESDPLLGNRSAIPGCPATSDFTLQADGSLRRRIEGLPQFVIMRGGAYFFLPSLRALRYFAGEGNLPAKRDAHGSKHTRI
ncbi:MAG: peroxidase, partial [Chthoniobacteraceae bacterium]